MIGDMFCAGEDVKDLLGDYCNQHNCEKCPAFKHKWPTPEQFLREYGCDPREESESGYDMPYWYRDFFDQEDDPYRLREYGIPAVVEDGEVILIACTPYGCPPSDYRPEEEE